MIESVLLAIQSYPGANDQVQRHWKYWLRQEADWIYGIGTTDGQCEWPGDAPAFLNIGIDDYLNGPHLPQRMIDIIKCLLELPWRILIFSEQDCIFFRRIPVENMNHDADVALYLAGHQTWNSLAQHFYHSPWLFKREAAIRFVDAGQRAIDEGVCSIGSPESSPDVFLGYIVEQYGFKIQTDLWREYSRNNFEKEEHLMEARKAYLDGVHVIHGVKRLAELYYIENGNFGHYIGDIFRDPPYYAPHHEKPLSGSVCRGTSGSGGVTCGTDTKPLPAQP